MSSTSWIFFCLQIYVSQASSTRAQLTIRTDILPGVSMLEKRKMMIMVIMAALNLILLNTLENTTQRAEMERKTKNHSFALSMDERKTKVKKRFKSQRLVTPRSRTLLACWTSIAIAKTTIRHHYSSSLLWKQVEIRKWAGQMLLITISECK